MEKNIMKFRNPKRISDTMIDCEISYDNNHWIPFTCDLNDTGAIFDTKLLFDKLSATNPPLKSLKDEMYECSAYQFKLELHRRNILKEAETLIKETENVAFKLAWQHFQTYNNKQPIVYYLFDGLKFNEDAKNRFFQDAMSIKS